MTSSNSSESVIPEKLRQENFRFIKVGKYQKYPIEKRWQIDNNYVFNNNELVRWISEGGNYGVITGINNLIVIDFDNRQIQEELESKFPETLTSRSGGKELHHLFFKTDNPRNNKLLKYPKEKANSKDNETLLDIQGPGKFIVGPGSRIYKKDGSVGTYEIVKSLPIAEINMAEIEAIIFNGERIHQANTSLFKNVEQREPNTKEVIGKIKELIPIKKMLEDYGVDTSSQGTNTTCPLGHTSVSGKCLSYNEEKNLWHCFHCEEGGDIFSLYMKKEKCDFKKAIKDLTKKTGVNNYNNSDNESALELLARQQRREATELVANKILENYNIKTVKDDVKPEMWVYIDGIWKQEGKTFIKKQCRKHLGKALTAQLINEVILKIETMTYISFKDFFTNENTDLIPVKNGILNIKTKELINYDPQYRFFNKLPIEYNPDAEPKKIIEFIKQIVSSDDYHVLKELTGYCLLRKYPYHKIFILSGNGRNGKGRFLELLKSFLGIENCTNLSIKDLTTSEFMVSELHNKMVNLGADMSNIQLTNSGIIKELSGDDLITANRKHRSPIIFHNHAKLIFAMNEIPITNDQSLGFFSRIILVDFPYIFLDKKNMEEMEDLDKSKVRLANPKIIEEITSEEELSGMLNWALEGLETLRNNGTFSYSSTIDKIKGEWTKRSNSIKYYVENFIEDAEESDVNHITKQELKNDYTRWCKSQRLRTGSNKNIKDEMEERGYYETRTSSSGPRIWGGAKFREFHKIHRSQTIEDFSNLPKGEERLEQVEQLEFD